MRVLDLRFEPQLNRHHRPLPTWPTLHMPARGLQRCMTAAFELDRCIYAIGPPSSGSDCGKCPCGARRRRPPRRVRAKVPEWRPAAKDRRTARLRRWPVRRWRGFLGQLVFAGQVELRIRDVRQSAPDDLGVEERFHHHQPAIARHRVRHRWMVAARDCPAGSARCAFCLLVWNRGNRTRWGEFCAFSLVCYPG